MNPSEIAQFYDDRWEGFRYANRFKLIRAAAILDCVAQAKLESPSILDIGCGAGWLANILSMFGPTTAIDLSGTAVATARERYPAVDFHQADLCSWNPGRRFDLIVAQEVLEHFPHHTAFVDAVSRLLVPGGFLILTTPNRTTLTAMPPELRSGFQVQPIENPLNISELRSLFADRFLTRYLSTVVPGLGHRGLRYRVLNSQRLWRVLDSLLGPGSGAALARRAGLGLHLIWMGESYPA